MLRVELLGRLKWRATGLAAYLSFFQHRQDLRGNNLFRLCNFFA